MYIENDENLADGTDSDEMDMQIYADKEYAERLIDSYPHDHERQAAINWLENKGVQNANNIH